MDNKQPGQFFTGKFYAKSIRRTELVVDEGSGRPNRVNVELDSLEIKLDTCNNYGETGVNKQLSLTLSGVYDSPVRFGRITAFGQKAEQVFNGMLKGKKLVLEGGRLTQPLIVKAYGRQMQDAQRPNSPGFIVEELYLQQEDGSYKPIIGRADVQTQEATGAEGESNQLSEKFL